MFKSATFKLTGWYLALIMGLSLAFSFVLYQASSESLNSGFDRQRMALRQQLRDYYGIIPSPFGLDRIHNSEVTEAQQQLMVRLVLANIAVLVVGGVASLYMARRTLGPIEQAMDAQARFTADASHELRTPLTAMQIEIEVALRDRNLSTQESRELLASNLEEVNKLRSLSNGLLALANQDKEHFVPKPVSTKTILSEATSRTAKAAEQKRINVDNQADNLTVYGDHDGLIQLFAILLDNAIKYSPAGTSIEITSTTKGSNAHISVADHGHGIKPGDLPHIFDRLYRADTSRNKEKVDGYGLGLSIAKKIVELHRGAIDVTSNVNHGSTFMVRIPLAPKEK
jgi:two-component system, OmpR family, sensor histidine kinase CiaH